MSAVMVKRAPLKSLSIVRNIILYFLMLLCRVVESVFFPFLFENQFQTNFYWSIR